MRYPTARRVCRTSAFRCGPDSSRFWPRKKRASDGVHATRPATATVSARTSEPSGPSSERRLGGLQVDGFAVGSLDGAFADLGESGVGKDGVQDLGGG